jgi:hypothetical protein
VTKKQKTPPTPPSSPETTSEKKVIEGQIVK